MERRDYLLTQIQQLGRFLRRLIEMMMGKSSSSNLEELMNQQHQEFKESCGFDIELLTTPVFEELKEAIITNNSYNPENIQLLADYMTLLASKNIDTPPTKIYRLKQNALKLYELLEVSEKTFSLERQAKMAELRRDLE
jgi:hypothetical protein